MTTADLLAAALQHHRAGQLPQAESLYRELLSQSPNHPDGLHLLGMLAMQSGHAPAAIELISRALSVAPNTAGYLNSLGNAFNNADRIEESAQAFERALAIDPRDVVAMYNLGNAMKKLARFDEARQCYARAIEIDRSLANAHAGLAAVDLDLKDFQSAMRSAREAIRLNPALPDGWTHLGAAQLETGQTQAALKTLQTAAQLSPNDAAVLRNAGLSLIADGRPRLALAAFERVLALEPNSPQAHLDLALTLLSMGDLERGFSEFEWRWKCKNFHSARWETSQPQWRGQPLYGRTILLHAEQGIGDTLQFIRYAKLVAQRGGRVRILCAAEVAELIATAPGVERVATEQTIGTIDFHCPLLSLPLALGTRLPTIPAEHAYLHADPTKVSAWRERLGAPDGRRRVGLVWAGNANHPGDHLRSISAEKFAPLAKASQIAFYTLQKGTAAAQIADLQNHLPVIDLTEHLTDFSQTAALIDNLDLVITVDTSVAHLSAAMGKPTWILLSNRPDWRWLHDRETSPWYPTARLFRQSKNGGWSEVIERVADELGRI